MTHAIEIQAVCKRFGSRSVLNGLDMRVEPGKTFAFLGRNGSGKTTTIRMLLGLLRRDDGAIRVLGLDPSREPLEVRQRVGYLAEDQRMYGWMTVDELIRFVAPFYRSWDHRYAAELVTQFELPLNTRVKHLSKGQNVRLGLLLALAHRPELVILDDPALGLDPIMRRDFNRDLVAHLQGQGCTVFYSSHLLYEVEPVADIIAILKEGHIVRQAETETLRDDVKQFVFNADDFEQVQSLMIPLDIRTQHHEVAVISEKAAQVASHLNAQNISHRVIDLNLDEIFEAYVVGRPQTVETPAREPAAVDNT